MKQPPYHLRGCIHLLVALSLTRQGKTLTLLKRHPHKSLSSLPSLPSPSPTSDFRFPHFP